MTQQPGPWSAQPPAAVPPQMVAPPRPGESWTPAHVEAVPGTEFGLVRLKVVPLTSGLAVGAMIAGIASIMVAVLVLCFGVMGASAGWGGVVAGAFALLGVLVGAGAMAVGFAARRQIDRSGREGRVQFTGRGAALAGIFCGGAGAGISVLALLLALVLPSS